MNYLDAHKNHLKNSRSKETFDEEKEREKARRDTLYTPLRGDVGRTRNGMMARGVCGRGQGIDRKAKRETEREADRKREERGEANREWGY